MSDDRRVYVDSTDFSFYQEILKDDYFKKNIDLFACAALVGKYVIGKSKSIEKRKQYLIPSHNSNSESMIILKCLAISECDDVNVLSDPEKLYTICEGYARTGIKQIYEWYTDRTSDFETHLAEVLLKAFSEIDLGSINLD